MSRRYNSKDFKDLQAKWDAKLKKEGFKDIEQREDGLLKSWSSRPFTSKRNGSYYEDKIEYYKAKEEYFRKATHFLNDHKFKNKKESIIWEMHSNGASLDKITAFLISKHFRINRIAVFRVVKKLAKMMRSAGGEE